VTADAGAVRTAARPVTGLLLAAGRGERLASVCPPFRKPLVDVGGQPVISYTARSLILVATRLVVVAHPSTASELEACVQVAAGRDTPVDVVTQDSPGGVAAAVRVGLGEVTAGPIVLACADNVFAGVNAKRVTAALDGPATIAWSYRRLPADQARQFAVLDDRTGAPARLVQKPVEPPSEICWCGPVAVADAGHLRRRIDELNWPLEGEHEFTSVIDSYLAEGAARAVELRGSFFDIGRPGCLAKARQWMAGQDGGE
jgi:glucose-1-phosphate thymidylyltransferase